MWITSRTPDRRGRRLHHNVKLLCPIRLCLQVPAPHLRSDNLLNELHLFHDGVKVFNYEEACYVVRRAESSGDRNRLSYLYDYIWNQWRN